MNDRCVMNFENKVKAMQTFITQLDAKDNILIWGMGKHTEELLKYTDILNYKNVSFTDRNIRFSKYFGRRVIGISEVDFNDIDCVIISSYKFQDEIRRELSEDIKFRKKVITFYDDTDKGDFYRLPKGTEAIWLEGGYACWDDAVNDSEGYEKSTVLQKVFAATQKVIAGEAKYERDSVTFDESVFTWHLLTLIGIVAAEKKVVRVVDVGGALGSLYWQNKEILEQYKNNIIQWIVIEQKHYVELGHNEIENDNIRFAYDMDDIRDGADIIIFSGVLEYVDEYNSFIEKSIRLAPRFIIVERTPFGNSEQICVEHVGSSICESSYPIRIFEREKLIDSFVEYRLKAEFPALIDDDFYVNAQCIENKCLILERKNNFVCL